MKFRTEKRIVEVEPDFTDGNFIDDAEKMRDFKTLSKEEFLESYNYLTEAEYDNTAKLFKTLPEVERKSKNLEIKINLISGNTFDLEIYEPESGDCITIQCHDAETEAENKKITDEIRSWVDLLREE